MTQIIEGLEVGTDRPFQERLWFWERVGWVVMLLLVLAAIAGLTGTTGPLSSGKVEAAGAEIDYPRIGRWRAADSLTVTFAEIAGTTGTILIDDKFLEVFAIDSVTPQPAKVVATPRGQEFQFDLASAAAPRKVHFSVTPQLPAFPARASGTVSGEPYSFTFTVLP